MSATDPVVRGSQVRTLRRLRLWFTNGLLACCLVVFLLLAVGPHVLGYRTSTMLTGSMEPGISAGDIVVTVPRPASEAEVGDIISYHIPIEDHRVETHRITRVRHGADGSISIRTKGDANANVDPWVATLEGDTVWEVVAVVPEAGTVIRTLRTPGVRHVLLWGALAGALLLGLSAIWGRDPDPAEDEAPVATADDAAPPTLTVVPGARVLNLGALAEISHDAPGTIDLGRRFAGRYQQLLPLRTTRIADALTVGDVEAAMEAVLSLKVSSQTVGALELAGMVERVEERLQGADVSGALVAMQPVVAAAARAHGALAAYLAA